MKAETLNLHFLEFAGLRIPLAVLSLAVGLLAGGSSLRADDVPTRDRVKRIGTDSATGFSRAVIVEQQELIHTGQYLPSSTHKGIEYQIAETWLSLAAHLRRQGSDVSEIVKLNVYVAKAEIADEVRRFLAKDVRPGLRAAVSFVETTLPDGVLPGRTLVAMDAIALVKDASRAADVAQRLHKSKPRIAVAATLPIGPRVYISGQAEKGSDLSEATTKTLESLKTTMKHLRLVKENVVQVKCFLTPMSEVAKAEEAIVQHFGGSAPPCVFVEWQSSLPIEIEMIVADPDSDKSDGKSNAAVPPREPLEFITPPGMTASPVFCRVVRVNDPRTIFVSGLFSREATDGAGQVTDVFDQLQDILKQSGSDFRHLVKATYYVSDNDASTKLTELRPKFYDPQRPPAASKAQVIGVGMAGRSLTLDMIAVPSR